MGRLLGALGLVGGIVLLLVLGGRLTGVWSGTGTAKGTPPSTEPAVVQPAAPSRRAQPIRTKPRAQATADRRARRRWIRQANAICRRAAHESAALGAQLSEQRNIDALVRLAEAERAVEARTLDELRTLGPPPGGRYSLSRLVAVGRRRDRIEQRVIRSVRRHDVVAALSFAPDFELAQREFGAIAAALGAESCGEPDLGALATTALDGVPGDAVGAEPT